MTSHNAISARVARIEAGDDPLLLAELGSGYAVFAKYQPTPVRGGCMLLPRTVVASPNDLSGPERERFFGDLMLLGDAILAVTGAQRVNYLVLCNQVPELHGHGIPRFAEEDPVKRLQGPFEAYDFAQAPLADPEAGDRELIDRLRAELAGQHS